jgi:glycine/D-amino acid oxidase-like deaminating enzyme
MNPKKHLPRIVSVIPFIKEGWDQSMARIGAFCLPGTGHVNPTTALARPVQQRGHTVVIDGIAGIEAPVKAADVSQESGVD